MAGRKEKLDRDMFQNEREFVKTAKACLQDLAAETSAPAGLETIIDCAKSVQARAVMLAAERCLIPARENRLSAAYELRTLTRLVGQFEDGLIEIDAGAADYIAGKTKAPVALPVAEIVQIDAADEIATRAADTLENVLPFAPVGDRAALESLLRLGRGSDENADKAGSDNEVGLESLIAPVTSEALSCAHRANKQLSLSYACEHVSVPPAAAPALQALLISVCGALIDLSLRHPAARETAGLPATGQIALTATQTARGLTLDVFCDDLAVEREDFLSPGVTAALGVYREKGGDLTFSGGRPSGVMLCVTHGVKARTAAPVPTGRLREAIA